MIIFFSDHNSRSQAATSVFIFVESKERKSGKNAWNERKILKWVLGEKKKEKIYCHNNKTWDHIFICSVSIKKFFMHSYCEEGEQSTRFSYSNFLTKNSSL